MSDIETISTGIDLWLRSELVSSRNDNNAVLDDFNRFTADFGRPAEGAMDFMKGVSHHNRYRNIMGQVSDGIFTADVMAAKAIHHALMFVSGGFRKQAYLQSANVAGYEAFRFGSVDKVNGACVPDISDLVGANWLFSLKETSNVADYVDMQVELNNRILEKHQSVYTWFQENPDHGKDALTTEDEPVVAMFDTQYTGLVMALSTLSVAAWHQSGDIASVPVLGAKSITRAEQTTWGAMITDYSVASASK